MGVSEATVTVPGPTDDPQANGTWLKYLWLQSCGERECSRPPTAAGAIAHRVVYGTNGLELHRGRAKAGEVRGRGSPGQREPGNSLRAPP